jgi:hypothetical protein
MTNDFPSNILHLPFTLIDSYYIALLSCVYVYVHPDVISLTKHFNILYSTFFIPLPSTLLSMTYSKTTQASLSLFPAAHAHFPSLLT